MDRYRFPNKIVITYDDGTEYSFSDLYEVTAFNELVASFEPKQAKEILPTVMKIWATDNKNNFDLPKTAYEVANAIQTGIGFSDSYDTLKKYVDKAK